MIRTFPEYSKLFATVRPGGPPPAQSSSLFLTTSGHWSGVAASLRQIGSALLLPSLGPSTGSKLRLHQLLAPLGRAFCHLPLRLWQNGGPHSFCSAPRGPNGSSRRQVVDLVVHAGIIRSTSGYCISECCGEAWTRRGGTPVVLISRSVAVCSGFQARDPGPQLSRPQSPMPRGSPFEGRLVYMCQLACFCPSVLPWWSRWRPAWCLPDWSETLCLSLPFLRGRSPLSFIAAPSSGGLAAWPLGLCLPPLVGWPHTASSPGVAGVSACVCTGILTTGACVGRLCR